MKCGRQRLAHQFAQIQGLATFRNVREQNLDKGMLAVERGALVCAGLRPLDELHDEVGASASRGTEDRVTGKCADGAARGGNG